MNSFRRGSIGDALRLTGTGRLVEATQALQRVLRGSGLQQTPADGAPGRRPLDALLDRALPLRGTSFGAPASAEASTEAPSVRQARSGEQFLSANYAGPAGNRAYKLYVPRSYCGQPVPLIVMLHGCTQSPEDFAIGTRMNEAAEAADCLVAYPEQTSAANMSKCWNWFNAADQQRGRGEPSIIAGITGQIMRDYAVDRRRVFIAGLSAGGAAASIMSVAYPELYAAIGVHSGLACGAATDMSSALSAMRNGHPGRAPKRGAASLPRRVVPAIVFHGDRDTTVHPANGDAVIAQTAAELAADSGVAGGLSELVDTGRVPGGRAYSRSRYADGSGAIIMEHWTVHGSGHAWSGGSRDGTYTDPQGPDATREMLRFFLQHPMGTA